VCVLWNCLFGRGQVETQRGFCRERNQQEASSPNAIRRWVRQWREEGSVTCKKPPGRPSSVRTLDKLSEETLQAVMRSFLTHVHL
jgi:transposase